MFADRLSRNCADTRCSCIRRRASGRRIFASSPGQRPELAFYGATGRHDNVGALEQLHEGERVWTCGYEQLQSLCLWIVRRLALWRGRRFAPRPRRRLRRPLRAGAAARQASRKRRGDIQDEERRHKECVALPRRRHARLGIHRAQEFRRFCLVQRHDARLSCGHIHAGDCAAPTPAAGSSARDVRSVLLGVVAARPADGRRDDALGLVEDAAAQRSA